MNSSVEYVWYFPEEDKLEVFSQFVHNEFMSVYGIFDRAHEEYLGVL